MSPPQIGRGTSSIKRRHAPFVRDGRTDMHRRIHFGNASGGVENGGFVSEIPFTAEQNATSYFLPSFSCLILPPSLAIDEGGSRSVGDRYSLDAECSRIFPITAARSMLYSAKWDRPRDVCAYANREWKMRTRLRKGEGGE